MTACTTTWRAAPALWFGLAILAISVAMAFIPTSMYLRHKPGSYTPILNPNGIGHVTQDQSAGEGGKYFGDNFSLLAQENQIPTAIRNSLGETKVETQNEGGVFEIGDVGQDIKGSAENMLMPSKEKVETQTDEDIFEQTEMDQEEMKVGRNEVAQLSYVKATTTINTCTLEICDYLRTKFTNFEHAPVPYLYGEKQPILQDARGISLFHTQLLYGRYICAWNKPDNANHCMCNAVYPDEKKPKQVPRSRFCVPEVGDRIRTVINTKNLDTWSARFTARLYDIKDFMMSDGKVEVALKKKITGALTIAACIFTQGVPALVATTAAILWSVLNAVIEAYKVDNVCSAGFIFVRCLLVNGLASVLGFPIDGHLNGETTAQAVTGISSAVGTAVGQFVGAADFFETEITNEVPKYKAMKIMCTKDMKLVQMEWEELDSNEEMKPELSYKITKDTPGLAHICKEEGGLLRYCLLDEA